MIINENIYGLFDYSYYTFPDGNFIIPLDKREFNLKTRTIVILDKELFALNHSLKVIFQTIENNESFNQDEYPLVDCKNIAVDYTLFDEILKSSDVTTKRLAYKIAKKYYYLVINVPHDIKDADPMEFILKFRDIKGQESASKLYFETIRKFYSFILTIQSPYINMIDLNQIYSDGIFSFFEKDNGKQITEVYTYKYSRFMPKTDHLSDDVKSIIDEDQEVKIEDLFMARAKVYLRLENYTMAIIESIISIEVIVPQFINEYLRSKGVAKNSVEDFNNKFGLSVRVKALLKLILPVDTHEIIDKVGTVIKLRNKIMHEGLINNKLDKSLNISDLINACEILKTVIELKKNGD